MGGVRAGPASQPGLRGWGSRTAGATVVVNGVLATLGLGFHFRAMP